MRPTPQVRVPEELHLELKIIAARQHTTIAAIVEQLLKKALAQEASK